MAQLVERCVRNAEVTSSNLVISTIKGTAKAVLFAWGKGDVIQKIGAKMPPIAHSEQREESH